MIDLDMGEYAAFVWPAWAISAIVLGAVVARVVSAARRWSAELERLDDGPNRAQVARSAVAPEQ